MVEDSAHKPMYYYKPKIKEEVVWIMLFSQNKTLLRIFSIGLQVARTTRVLKSFYNKEKPTNLMILIEVPFP